MKKLGLRGIVAVAFATSLLTLPGCGRRRQAATTPATPQPVNTATRTPAKPARSAAASAMRAGYIEEGVASWYGVPYHGRPAADGEIYNMETLVAAHRVMPFNSWVRVTNLNNGKSVEVRIIDRGPFVEGRCLDLSKAAARQIDMIGPGTAPVRLEIIAAPSDIAANDFYAVQIGAFSVYANAERARNAYAQRFGTAQLAVKQGTTPLWRVLVGKENSLARAQQLADELKAENQNIFVVRLDETIPTAPPANAPPAATSAPASLSPLPTQQ